MAKTVLIVEDDRNIADLLRLYLEKEGYTVVIAPDGMRGVEQFRTVHPSLVLLDVMLPGLDGWGVCRAIRAESQTPIIMLTAKSETEDKVNGLKHGRGRLHHKALRDEGGARPHRGRAAPQRHRAGEEPPPSGIRQARHRHGRL